MKSLPAGLYDLLYTAELKQRLEAAGLLDRAVWSKVDVEELKRLLAVPLAREIAAYIGQILSSSPDENLVTTISDNLQRPEEIISIIEALRPVALSVLSQIKPSDHCHIGTKPDIPLSISALLTGSSRTPSLKSQLTKELSCCDRCDWLVSFIKLSGIMPLMPALHEFTSTPTPDGRPRLRIATTSYLGATDFKAVKLLVELPNTEVRVSYDTKRTRLHAKSYIFHRETGFGSAYIGSANISKAALDDGLEWTAKISQYETAHLWQHTLAAFETHWEDTSEFSLLTKENLKEFETAIGQEKGINTEKIETHFFDLRPFGFQQAILEDLSAEREAGRKKHLIIAATGTGKTMVAAFDYRNFCGSHGGFPNLLFVAHREEILTQARSAFRQVLKNGSFGELLVGNSKPEEWRHVFCSVQSWNSRDLTSFKPEHFAYVVLDEAHHAAASSYQKLISHVKPASLLGLTATPERSDGQDIRTDFDGSFTHEIRLPEAIERALLAPFHYYGVPDLEGIDFSLIEWKRGAYDARQLASQIENNKSRAEWVLGQVDRYLPDLKSVCGLGFCVSVEHARFMAEFCSQKGLPSLALTASSSDEERLNARQRLDNRELRFIFTVDLYNEGIDIPRVDVVLFLRPTESLTVFLQQLGRGLRLHTDKSHLTVLDFIAPQNRNFRFARRFRALTSRPELPIDRQIDNGMPFIPAGCHFFLEKQAKEHVLNNIKAATSKLRGQRLVAELAHLRDHISNMSLSHLLEELGLDEPQEFYDKAGYLPHQLIKKVVGQEVNEEEMEWGKQLLKGFQRLSLLDDCYLFEDAVANIDKPTQRSVTLELLHSVLWGKNRPEGGSLENLHNFIISRPGFAKDLRELLFWLLQHRPPISRHRFAQTGLLNLHASYTREQVLLALGQGTFEKPRSSREGVLNVEDRKIDLFFADINKSEVDYSPTTMYEDYAITEKLFHWQSQSQTSENSTTGQRYIKHRSMNYTPMLFIRDRKKLTNGLTAPYFFAGPLNYRSHSGEKPISFVWELEHPLPARILTWARQAA